MNSEERMKYIGKMKNEAMKCEIKEDKRRERRGK